MKPVALIILDGWGFSREQKGNAIAAANTPTLDSLEKEFPSGLLQASGIAVGLPWKEPGNSEVGHRTMGTGQIRYQSIMLIDSSIRDGTFFENPVFKEAMAHTKKFSSSLHIMGLFGSGSVHSYLDHLWALVEMASQEGVPASFHRRPRQPAPGGWQIPANAKHTEVREVS